MVDPLLIIICCKKLVGLELGSVVDDCKCFKVWNIHQTKWVGVLDGKVSRYCGNNKGCLLPFRKKKRLSKVSVQFLRVLALPDHMIQGLGWGGGQMGGGSE